MTLDHLQDAAVDFSTLTAHTSADISDPAKMHKYNAQAVILTAQCNLISLLEVKKSFFFHTVPQLYTLSKSTVYYTVAQELQF